LDWLSRIGENPPLKGKPVSMISATAGRGGGGRAQYALRLSLVWSEARVLSKPECLIGPASAVFKDGALADEMARKFLAEHLQALIAFAKG
jgi:chromate reductase